MKVQIISNYNTMTFCVNLCGDFIEVNDIEDVYVELVERNEIEIETDELLGLDLIEVSVDEMKKALNYK